MNIDDFENYLDEKILTRGHNYFMSGNVVSLEYDGDEWVAEVEGSDDYTVTASLSDDGEILDTGCDCPYDWGEYCKHQAAVFFAIRDELRSGKQPVRTRNNAIQKESLESVLKGLDKQALISVLLEFSARDNGIKEELLLRYAKKTDILESARNIIRGSINAVKRRGYVAYSDAGRAVKGADTILQMIDDKIDSGDILPAVSLSVVVLEEMMDLMDCCDDSGADVGSAISEAIEKIQDTVCAIPDDQIGGKKSEEIFDIILNHAASKLYNGWTDWRIALLTAAAPLCANSVNRGKMDEYIVEEERLKRNGDHNYDAQQYQRLQYDIIKRFDGEEAASSYMEQNLDNSDFRRIAIKTAISGGLYERALRLCLDGETKDNAHPGLTREWKQQRGVIYEKTNDIPAQKSLCMEFVLKGDFDYFPKLKSLYTNDEWDSILPEIINKIENSRQTNVYINILIHENLKSKLFDYCQKHIFALDSYYKYLLPEYKKEITPLFAGYIRERAASSNNGNSYRDVCESIRHFKQVSGAAANQIIDELTRTYMKRPAFLDELRQIRREN